MDPWIQLPIHTQNYQLISKRLVLGQPGYSIDGEKNSALEPLVGNAVSSSLRSVDAWQAHSRYVMAVLNSFLRPLSGTRVCSGSIRDPFGVRAGSIRDPFGVRARSVRGPREVRSESVRVPSDKKMKSIFGENY